MRIDITDNEAELMLWSVLSLGSTSCQSKTLSSPDFESTYTNKASFGALAVC